MVNSNIMQNHNQLTVATGQPSWLGWQRVLPCRGSWMSMFLLSHCGGRRTCSARMDHLAGKTWAWQNLCSIKQRWDDCIPKNFVLQVRWEDWLGILLKRTLAHGMDVPCLCHCIGFCMGCRAILDQTGSVDTNIAHKASVLLNSL